MKSGSIASNFLHQTICRYLNPSFVAQKCMKPRTTDTRRLNLKFFVAQIEIEIPLPIKYLGVGYKGLQTFPPIMSAQVQKFEIFEKKLSLEVRSPCMQPMRCFFYNIFNCKSLVSTILCLKEWKRRFLFLDKILQFQPLWLLKSYLPTFFSFRSCTLVVMKTTTLHFYLMICLSTEASRAVFLIWPTKPALANFYPCQGILNEGFQIYW